MIQKQHVPLKKTVKHTPPKLKVIMEHWCRLHRIWIISLIISISVLIRIVYFIQLRETHLINEHIYHESDMSFFDYWAGEIAKGDILSRNIHQPEHTWMKWVADHYFADHPDKLAFFKAKTGADTLKKTPTILLWEQWYGEQTFQQEPLYPYFIALNYALFGHDVRWVFLWQMILGVITNLLVYLVTRRYFGDLAGAIAGILIVLFGPLLFFELVLLRTSLAVFFGILVVYLLGRSILKDSFIWWIITGIGCGLALLVHAFFMLFILGTILILLIIHRKEREKLIRSAGGAMIGVILVLTPVMIRNAALGVPVMSLSNTGTLSFITMNNVKFESFIGWNMSTKYLSDIMGSSNGKLFKAILPTLMTHQTIGSYLGQVWDKFHATFSWFEIPNNVNFYFYRKFAPVLNLTFLSFLILSPLALIGIALGIIKRINAWPLYLIILVFLFPMLAFMVLARYRIIFAGVLIPFAALTISELFRSWKGWKNWLIVLFLCGVGYWTSKPGSEKVSKITKEDYSGAWSIHYGDTIKKALEQKQWPVISRSLKDYFTRYEPDNIKNITPFYRCKGFNEAEIFRFFSSMHESLAFIYQQAGDTNTAKVEGNIAIKLKTAANQ